MRRWHAEFGRGPWGRGWLATGARVTGADDVREIRMIFTTREVVLMRRAINVALEDTAPFTDAELALLDEIETGFGMIVTGPRHDGEASDGTIAPESSNG